MPSVRVKVGPQKGSVWDFSTKPLVVGRDPGEGVALLDLSASRRHAEFFQVGEMCFVRDMGSKNGTLVNDKAIDEELLKEGDRIRVGETVLVFETGIGAPAEPAAPEFMPDEERLNTTMELRLDTTQIRTKAAASPSGREAALEALYQVGKALASLRETKPLLTKVLELASAAVKADSGYLFLKDEQKGTLISQASWGTATKVSGSIVRRAMQECRALMTAEALSDDRFREQRSVMIHRIGPVLCAPLASPEKVRGALYVAKKFGAPRFTEDDLDLLAMIGMQAGIALENVIIHERSRASVTQMIRALVGVMEMREPETKGHAERVAAYSLAVAKQLGAPEEEAHRIQLAALLHDIGKIAVKPGQGDDKPGSGVRMPGEHVFFGERLLEKVPAMAEFAAGAKFHHERMDGSGFPKGLKGDEIPLAGRIIMLTNWYDNMTTTAGIGRQGMQPKEVLKELQAMAGKEFDTRVAQAMIVAYRNGTLYAPETLYDEGWAEAL